VLLPQPGWHRVAVAAILVIPLLTLILLSLPAWITWPFLSTERRTTVLWRRARPAHLAEPPLQLGLRRQEPPADTPPSQNQRFAQRRTPAERVRATVVWPVTAAFEAITPAWQTKRPLFTGGLAAGPAPPSYVLPVTGRGRRRGDPAENDHVQLLAVLAVLRPGALWQQSVQVRKQKPPGPPRSRGPEQCLHATPCRPAGLGQAAG
jgi:hypothetical protein